MSQNIQPFLINMSHLIFIRVVLCLLYLFHFSFSLSFLSVPSLIWTLFNHKKAYCDIRNKPFYYSAALIPAAISTIINCSNHKFWSLCPVYNAALSCIKGKRHRRYIGTTILYYLTIRNSLTYNVFSYTFGTIICIGSPLASVSVFPRIVSVILCALNAAVTARHTASRISSGLHSSSFARS